MVPNNMAIVLIGQFIKNIGGLPCAYVFMALFADVLDHLEWKSGIRCDGTAISIYGIIACCLGGLATSIFNAMLSSSGYVAPEFIDGVTVAYEQTEVVKNVITFAFVGLESITGILLAGLLIFLSVEKNIGKKQAMIRARQKNNYEKDGKEWISPEMQATLDEEKFVMENEINFAKELKIKCEKKGLNYEEELLKHQVQIADKKLKQQEKKKLIEEKLAKKQKKDEEKRNAKEAKLSPEQLEKKQIKEKKKQEKDDIAWAIELEKGEKYYQKIQLELNRKRNYDTGN